MFARDALRDLFLHMEWADAQIWNAVMKSDAAQEDPTLRGLLLHLHVVQRAFLAVWTSSPVTFPDPSDFRSIAELRDFPRSYYREALAVLERVQEPALDRAVIMPWAGQLATRLGREPAHPTLAETMFQVTSHSTYHRGQVNARLRAVGGEPPLVDYIAWIWFGRPGA